MSKLKKSKKYDDYFESIETDLIPDKYEASSIESAPELIWFYCPQCRGNSRAWNNKTPLQCFKCSYSGKVKERRNQRGLKQ